METKYTFALTRTPKDESGRMHQAIEVLDHETGDVLALVRYDDAAAAILSAEGKLPAGARSARATEGRLVPPAEHANHRWHWVKTEHGPMPASWYPAIGEGTWDVSGHTKAATDPTVLHEWEYLGPAFPPVQRA